MLPKKQRITRSTFPHILKRGRSIHSGCFSLKYVRAKGRPQFSLVISKKVIKRASERHRLKRRVYEILRVGAKTTNICGVFFAKQEAATLSFANLKEEVMDLVRRTRL